jgi:hypothetical protein
VAALVFVTLVLGTAVSLASGNVVTTRYAAACFFPLAILLALGIESFGSPVLRLVLVVGLSATGLWAAHEYRGTARTQAPEAVSVLDRYGSPGDVVAFCPDQLGPPTARLLPVGRYEVVTFPRFTGPDRIDWIDYEQVVRATSPVAFAARLVALAGPHSTIWLAWSPHAWGLHGECGSLATALSLLRPDARLWFTADPNRYYQPFSFSEYSPRPSPKHPRRPGTNRSLR